MNIIAKTSGRYKLFLIIKYKKPNQNLIRFFLFISYTSKRYTC